MVALELLWVSVGSKTNGTSELLFQFLKSCDRTEQRLVKNYVQLGQTAINSGVELTAKDELLTKNWLPQFHARN